ncbi:MAG: hypothetical protein GEU92_21150, partial [Alphaproteobacteria bacterium]|nr:hypothetical protein [Alphaproteobacteria bacterium]
MTRDSGQLTSRQALAGLLLIAAVAAGIVTGLALLLERGGPEPPLEAPAEPAGPAPCPDLAGSDQQEPPLVPADDLIACPDAYDGQRVRYRGEVVRAVLRRGDTAWVQLNDDLYGLDLGPLPEHRTAVGGNSGLPVAIPASAVDPIQHVGDHRHHGDVLEVTGPFLRADPLDAGGP